MIFQMYMSYDRFKEAQFQHRVAVERIDRHMEEHARIMADPDSFTEEEIQRLLSVDVVELMKNEMDLSYQLIYMSLRMMQTTSEEDVMILNQIRQRQIRKLDEIQASDLDSVEDEVTRHKKTLSVISAVKILFRTFLIEAEELIVPVRRQIEKQLGVR